MAQGKNEHGGPLGGQELPPEVQDRPEQNKGYDEAVAGRSGRPGAMQVGTTGVMEERRRHEGDEAAGGADTRGEPAPDKAEGERNTP